tara:strand:- start:33 stop:560 length:528 start_codon:yes stop_codon:yes gene_type:complete
MVSKNYKKILIEDKSGRSKSFYFKQTNEKDIEFIKKFLNQFSISNGKDARICLHSDYKDVLQDMVLIQHSKNFYPPHKHVNRYDSYFVLKGCLGVIIFNNIGEIKRSFRLPKGSIYKTPKNQYHLTIPISKKVIYHEYRSGTFNRKTNCIFPRWGPKTENDRKIFKKNILKILNK